MDCTDKIILEALCKTYIINQIDKNRSDFKDIAKFVISELSYQDVMLMTFDPKTYFLHEGEEAGANEVALQRKLKDTEGAVRPYLSLGLAIAAGGKFIAPMAAAAAKHAGVLGAIGASMGGTIALGFGLSLVLKIIKYLIMRQLSPCYKSCKQRVPPTDSLSKIANKICQAECRYNAYNKVIMEIKAQRSRCNKTGNANKCAANLNKALAKYQNLAGTEFDKLQDLKQKYAEKQGRG